MIKMRDKKNIQYERPKFLFVISSILFSCGIISLINFFIKFPSLRIHALSDLFYGSFLIFVGYLIFTVSKLTMGISASFLLGIGTLLFYVSQESFGIAIFWRGLGPIIAAILGIFMRRRIIWLREREQAMFGELKFILRLFREDKVTLVAIGVIVLYYLIVVIAPYIAPYDPNEIDTTNILASPSQKHSLGTDIAGRDILSRVIYGTRISMIVGVVTVGVTVIIGVPIGSIAAYFGGKLDELLMRITDIFLAFPSLILAMLFAYIMGRGVLSAMLGLSMVGWTVIARLIRGVILVEKEKEYVIAARALGKSDFKILSGEILPNSLHPVITSAMLSIGYSIISMAGLSFLGLGTQPPTPDWGVMISNGRHYLTTQPLMALTPGILIIIAVLSFNLIGDKLRDALDPRLRRQR